MINSIQFIKNAIKNLIEEIDWFIHEIPYRMKAIHITPYTIFMLDKDLGYTMANRKKYLDDVWLGDFEETERIHEYEIYEFEKKFQSQVRTRR